MIFINIRVKNLTLHEKNAESYRNCTKKMQNFAKLARKRCNGIGGFSLGVKGVIVVKGVKVKCQRSACLSEKQAQGASKN